MENKEDIPQGVKSAANIQTCPLDPHTEPEKVIGDYLCRLGGSNYLL